MAFAVRRRHYILFNTGVEHLASIVWQGTEEADFQVRLISEELCIVIVVIRFDAP